jgi:hypothetical protein
MSEETKQAGTDTHHSLERAEKHLKDAQQSAGNTKDPGLIQKVTKLREAVTETKTDLGKKLENNPKKD